MSVFKASILAACSVVLCLLLASALGQPAEARELAGRPTEDQATPTSAQQLQQVDALFAEGTKLYRRGEYGPAAASFGAALEASPPGSELLPAQRVRILRALGNCSFRRGDAFLAVGWYSAALRHAPRDRALWADVELARSEAGMPPADQGDLSSTVHYLLRSWRPEEARLLALVGALLLCVAMVFEIVRGGMLSRWALVASACVALVLSLPWFAALLPEPSDPQLVLRASAVPVRSEPNAEQAVVAHLQPGSVVTRLDSLDQWVRIEGPDEAQGWVPMAAVFALER